MDDTRPTLDPAAAELIGTDPGEVVVIGAGPAGLTAAFQLHKYGIA